MRPRILRSRWPGGDSSLGNSTRTGRSGGNFLRVRHFNERFYLEFEQLSDEDCVADAREDRRPEGTERNGKLH